MTLTLAEIFPAGEAYASSIAENIVQIVTRRLTPPYITPNTDDLTHPGGLVEELVDWVVLSAERPSRWLALSAVLPFVGALIGRRFESPTGLRSNLYVAALAPSGYGKDHARGQLKRLALKAGLKDIFGPSRFMSATALRNAVMKHPSCVSMIDEFDSMMLQINDPRSGIHNGLIRGDLKDLWSSASTYFEGSEYANVQAIRMHNPNLCIYGTGTPVAFWKSVSSLNTSDGLLPRFLLFDVSGPKPARVVPANDLQDVPAKLVEACKSLSQSGRVGNLQQIRAMDSGEIQITALRVPLAEDALIALEDFKRQIEEFEFAIPEESGPMLNRAAEHAIKLALIVSVATKHDNPTITGTAMRWAIRLSWYSTNRMISETRDRIADTAREAGYNRIVSQIKHAEGGITEGQLADKNRGMDERVRKEILRDLQASERIVNKTTAGKTGRPRARLHYIPQPLPSRA